MGIADNYIPIREAAIRYGGHDIPVAGIREFRINLDRLRCNYSVWVTVNDATPITSTTYIGNDVIKTTPTDIDLPATIVIDDLPFPCTIKKFSYVGMKHAYIIDLEMGVELERVKAYIYEKDDDKNKEYTRFDLLDL